MTYTLHGYGITGRIVGRSDELDGNARRCYLFLSRAGNLFLLSGDQLREAL